MPAPHKPVELREIPEPVLENNSALMNVEFSEVCGTDVHLQEGRLAGVPYPIIPGHVSVGRLSKIRGTMRDINGNPFAEGDRVTFLDVHKTCNECWHCLVAKASTRCPHRKVYGITYGLEDGLTGGWTQQLYLKPGVRVIRMDDVDSRLFMAGGCSLPTALHAVDRAEIQIAESVLVLGAGPVGLSCIGFASQRGPSKILCIGAPAHRLEVAKAVGADATMDITAHDESARRDWVMEHTAGRGVDVTIEAAGAPIAVPQAMRWTRDAGRVVIVGQYTDCGDIPINPHLDINKKHLDIRGCWGSDYSHFHRGVQILKKPAAQKIWSHVKTEAYNLDQANQALADVAAGKAIKALIVPRV
jgi:L-iditol 2-dehydrogenase